MDSKTYIRACALFMFDQGKSPKETTQVISDLYPLDAVTERNCARWFAKFRAGDRSLQDLPRSRRPQILDRQSLKAAVDADPSVTCRELAIEFGCCQKTIINGLHEIGKVCKRGRWIPRPGPSARRDAKTPKIRQKGHVVRLVEYKRNRASRGTGKRSDG